MIIMSLNFCASTSDFGTIEHRILRRICKYAHTCLHLRLRMTEMLTVSTVKHERNIYIYRTGDSVFANRLDMTIAVE